MKNILLVEDEQSLSTSLADLLTQEGVFSVLVAANGWEALKILGGTPIHLVVTDLRMPQMDGFELLANIFSRKSAPPAIVISAFATPIIRKKLMDIGVVEVLDKPIDLDMLVAAIQTGLQRGAFGERLGFPLGSFVQAMETEQKTALLDVLDGHGKRGFLFMEEGVLADAILADLEGEAAARKMLLWPRAIARFRDIPAGKIRRNIQLDAATLIAQPVKPVAQPGRPEAAPARPMVRKAAPQPAGRRIPSLDETFGDMLEPEDLALPYEWVISTGEAPTRIATEVVKKVFGKEDPQTARARETLKEMAEKMEYVRACLVVSRDGAVSAAYGPSIAKDNGFGPSLSSVMDLLDTSIRDLDFGAIEENLLQTEKAWVLTRFLDTRYCLIIAVGRLSSLGDVRMVIKQYTDKLVNSLP